MLCACRYGTCTVPCLGSFAGTKAVSVASEGDQRVALEECGCPGVHYSTSGTAIPDLRRQGPDLFVVLPEDGLADDGFFRATAQRRAEELRHQITD